jgi:hypothetical protein
MFLDDTEGNIVLNLPCSSLAVVFIQILLCVVMLFTFILFLQPIAELAEDAVSKYRARRGKSMTPNGKGMSKKDSCCDLYGNLVRTILVIGCAALGVSIPSFGLVTNLVGAVTNTIVGLILPPAIYIQLARRYVGKSLDSTSHSSLRRALSDPFTRPFHSTLSLDLCTHPHPFFLHPFFVLLFSLTIAPPLPQIIPRQDGRLQCFDTSRLAH